MIIISDEEDCGKPGDVDELTVAGGNICYFASKGVNPDGTTYQGKALESVDTYYNFLMNLKNNKNGMVKFAAIVGVTDVSNPEGTVIEYQTTNLNTDIKDACNMGGSCVGDPAYCGAKPGTRYINLARMFGIGSLGFIDTICQSDFSKTMADLGTFIGCPISWTLSQPILDPELANILVNGTPVPRDSWQYDSAKNTISFVGGYNPCDSVTSGTITVELVYVTK